MTVRIITAPTVEPVTRAQAKLWCRIDSDDTSQDAVIDMLIQSMREYAENLTGRAFVQRTLELTLPGFPEEGIIELPFPPLISVASVKYIDINGTLQTVASFDYQVDSYQQPGRVKPAWLKWWWQIVRDDFNAVQVRYDAGYAPSASPTDYAENVPGSVKTWMQARLATLFGNREQIITDRGAFEMPRDFADGLLDSLKVGKLFG